MEKIKCIVCGETEDTCTCTEQMKTNEIRRILELGLQYMAQRDKEPK